MISGMATGMAEVETARTAAMTSEARILKWSLVDSGDGTGNEMYDMRPTMEDNLLLYTTVQHLFF